MTARCHSSARKSLTFKERERLIAILGRLGSEFDAERATAAAKATKMLGLHGLTWSELICAASESSIPAADPKRRMIYPSFDMTV